MLILVALAACHDPRTPLLVAKQAMRAQELVLEPPSMNRAFASWRRAEELVQLPGLPLAPIATRDVSLSLLRICEQRSSGQDEVDLSQAPESSDCSFSGRLSTSYACAQENTRLTWTWHYDKVQLRCTDGTHSYDGDAALEINEAGGIVTTFVALDLTSDQGPIQSARYTYGFGGLPTVEVVVVTDKGSSALIAWRGEEGGHATRDLGCFIGRDARGTFTGSYVDSGEVPVMSLFAPADDDTPARYRVQSPEGTILPNTCTESQPLDICALPNMCD